MQYRVAKPDLPRLHPRGTANLQRPSHAGRPGQGDNRAVRLHIQVHDNRAVTRPDLSGVPLRNRQFVLFKNIYNITLKIAASVSFYQDLFSS